MFAVVALAGGFQLSAEVPVDGDPQLKEAVLVVRTFGCHEPSNAVLTATAEGIVGGQRRSLPLQLTLTATGVYALQQQWPAEGTWVVAITGTYRGMTSSLLVALDPEGRVQAKDGRQVAQGAPRKLSAKEIDNALKELAARRA